MSYKVEKGIAIPAHHWERYKKYSKPKQSKRKPRYPFRQMEVGDSFALPRNMDVDNVTRFRLIANAYSYKLGTRFVVLRDDTNFYRCWRIS